MNTLPPEVIREVLAYHWFPLNRYLYLVPLSTPKQKYTYDEDETIDDYYQDEDYYDPQEDDALATDIIKLLFGYFEEERVPFLVFPCVDLCQKVQSFSLHNVSRELTTKLIRSAVPRNLKAVKLDPMFLQVLNSPQVYTLESVYINMKETDTNPELQELELHDWSHLKHFAIVDAPNDFSTYLKNYPNLKTLTLTIPYYDFEYTLSLPHQSTMLTCLELTGTTFQDPQDLERILLGKTLPNLKSFSMIECCNHKPQFPTSGRNSTLKRLHITEQLSQKDCEHIVTYFDHLEQLSLVGCNIDDEGLSVLLSSDAAYFSTLTHFNVQSNPISCRNIEHCDYPPLLSSLSLSCTPTVWYASLAKYLNKCTNLESLSLMNYAYGSTDDNVILAILEHLPETVTKLSLSSIEICPVEMVHELVQMLRNITHLQLDQCNIDDHYGALLVENLENVHTLELQRNGISTEFMSALAENATITSVNLNFNEFVSLDELFEKNSTLNELSVCGIFEVEITDRGIEGLRQNNCLNRLGIDAASLSDENIIQELYRCTSIIELDIQ
jgi:hypothetical protein